MTNVTPTPATIAAEVQPVILAAVALAPTKAPGVKAWIRRYLKGEIAFVGIVATLALTVLPADGLIAHYAGVIVAAVTLIGIVEAENGI
jgi:hypothetical protein